MPSAPAIFAGVAISFACAAVIVASIEPDSDWRGLWRVRLPDGGLSDLVNRTTALTPNRFKNFWKD
jgi:hypothetical protein